MHLPTEQEPEPNGRVSNREGTEDHISGSSTTAGSTPARWEGHLLLTGQTTEDKKGGDCASCCGAFWEVWFQPWQAYRTQVRERVRDQLQLLHTDESTEDLQETLPLKSFSQVLVGQVQLLRTGRRFNLHHLLEAEAGLLTHQTVFPVLLQVLLPALLFRPPPPPPPL